MTDISHSEHSFDELGSSSRNKLLSLCCSPLVGHPGHANVEQEESMLVTATACAAVQKDKCSDTGKACMGDTQQTSKSECNNISMKSKDASRLARNQTHTLKALQPHSLRQTPCLRPNAMTPLAVSSDKAAPCAKTFTAKKKNNSETMQIQSHTSCQIGQQNLWCLLMQTPIPQVCQADKPHC